MRILAIDTSLADVSAAVSPEPGVIEVESFRHERDALQRLAALIGGLLRRCALGPQEIELVVCTRGPGSFTGLRVGVSAAKAFASAVGARVAGPSTLAMLAANVESPGALVVPLIEACPGEVYCGAYKAGDSNQAAVSDQVCFARELPDWIESLGSDSVVAVGPALEKYAQFSGPARAISGMESVDIRRVVAWARRPDIACDAVEAVEFQPEYLRASQAEVRRLRDASGDSG